MDKTYLNNDWNANLKRMIGDHELKISSNHSDIQNTNEESNKSIFSKANKEVDDYKTKKTRFIYNQQLVTTRL